MARVQSSAMLGFVCYDFVMQMRRLTPVVSLVLLLSCSDEDPVEPSRSPKVFTVDPYGDTGYLTVQDALNASADGDTIELVNGRHSGPGNRDLDFGGKSIVLRSQRGDALYCVLDADGYYLDPPDPHFNLRFGPSRSVGRPTVGPPTVAVENLRIEDGFESVVCDSGSAPVFRNCTFERSYRAVSCMGASPVFINCSFDNNNSALICDEGSTVVVDGGRVWQNYSFDDGGGIFVRASSLTVIGCEFIRNTADRGAAIYSTADYEGTRASVVVMDCNIHWAYGSGALYLEQTDFEFQNCVFSDNEGAVFVYEDSQGSFVGSIFYGEAIYVDSGSSVGIQSCVIAFNGSGPGVHCGYYGTATVQLTCSDLFDNADECILDQIGTNGNLAVDPKFCSFDEGEFSFYPDSPVVTNADCLRPGGWPVGCAPPPESRYSSHTR